MLSSSRPDIAWIIQHLCQVIFLFANGGSGQADPSTHHSSGKCPNAYWDEPSKKCSENLLRVLEEIRFSNHLVSAEHRFNKTCREWDKANDCYQKLIQQCHNDPNALQEIQLHISRYVIFSRPCTDPSLRYRQNMADCFLPDVKSTRTCTETIDKFLRRFIVSNDYRSACRVVSASMKCFHEIKDNILHRCRQEGANEYQHRYILPLVEQTRQLVLGQCNLTHPYDEYYALYSGAAGRGHHLPAASIIGGQRSMVTICGLFVLHRVLNTTRKIRNFFFIL